MSVWQAKCLASDTLVVASAARATALDVSMTVDTQKDGILLVVGAYRNYDTPAASITGDDTFAVRDSAVAVGCHNIAADVVGESAGTKSVTASFTTNAPGFASFIAALALR